MKSIILWNTGWSNQLMHLVELESAVGITGKVAEDFLIACHSLKGFVVCELDVTGVKFSDKSKVYKLSQIIDPYHLCDALERVWKGTKGRKARITPHEQVTAHIIKEWHTTPPTHGWRPELHKKAPEAFTRLYGYDPFVGRTS